MRAIIIKVTKIISDKLYHAETIIIIYINI